MIGRRLVAAFFGVTLALGGVAATAVSASAQTDPPTETPAPPANCDPVAFTVTLPGVGTVSFVADPCTGAISEVVVAPVDGVTVGDPVMTSEGVKIQITAADGTVRVLEIEAEIDDNGFKVETEIETDDDLDDSGDDDGTDSGDNHGSSPNAGPGNSGDSNSGPDAGNGTSGDGGSNGNSGSGGGSSDDGDGSSDDGGGSSGHSGSDD